jgi:predicted MFS family arabinose efflux permease
MFTGPVAPEILARNGEDGWRWCWFLFGGITLLLALSSLALLRNRPSDKGLRPLGEDSGISEDGPRARGLAWGSVYRSRRVWHLGMVYTAFGFSYIIYMTFFVKYLTAEAGYSRQEAGDLFMILGGCSLFCGLIWGTVSDRIGRRPALMIVYLIQAVSFSLFALAQDRVGLTISAVLFGLTAWSIPAIMAAACGDVLGARLAPAALGFITLFFGIGQAVGPGIAGAMADVAGSFAPAFLLAAGVAFLGLAGSWLLRPSVPREETQRS